MTRAEEIKSVQADLEAIHTEAMTQEMMDPKAAQMISDLCEIISRLTGLVQRSAPSDQSPKD